MFDGVLEVSGGPAKAKPAIFQSDYDFNVVSRVRILYVCVLRQFGWFSCYGEGLLLR